MIHPLSGSGQATEQFFPSLSLPSFFGLDSLNSSLLDWRLAAWGVVATTEQPLPTKSSPASGATLHHQQDLQLGLPHQTRTADYLYG